MSYHIDTALLYEAFASGAECPLCYIYREIDKRVVEGFTGEAIMEDDTRSRVNELGFCREHFKKLYDYPHKLGIALQSHTRLNTLKGKLSKVKTTKDAKKQAESLRATLSTCAVCEVDALSMDRYYRSIVKMYFSEPAFKKAFEGSKGFCLTHYAELLEFSSAAGLKAGEFLAALYSIESANLDRLSAELLWFTEKFDYRNSDKPWGDSRDSLQRVIDKIKNNRNSESE